MWPGVFSRLGWMILHLNNTYGFIRHGVRVTLLCLGYAKLLPGMIVLHDKMPYDRCIGTKEAFLQEAASVVSISDPRVGSAGPARGASARQGPSGKQLQV